MNDTFLEVMALNAEVEGMKVMNDQRLSHSLSLAYDEHAFYEIAEKIRKLKQQQLHDDVRRKSSEIIKTNQELIDALVAITYLDDSEDELNNAYHDSVDLTPYIGARIADLIKQQHKTNGDT